MVNAVISGYVFLKNKLNLVEFRECCLSYHQNVILEENSINKSWQAPFKPLL